MILLLLKEIILARMPRYEGVILDRPQQCGHQHADAAHALGLLCARRERPRSCRTAEQRDERATLHSIFGRVVTARVR
jgi:hypothetical protein